MYRLYITIQLLFDSEKKKIADEKNLVRMAKEMERTHENMKLTEADLSKIRLINVAIRDKLHAVEDRAMQEEEGLKVRSQIHIFANLIQT